MTMAAPLPYQLEIVPADALKFTITRDPPSGENADGASRCVMTLRHPGQTNSHLAFKVCFDIFDTRWVRVNFGIASAELREMIRWLAALYGVLSMKLTNCNGLKG